MLLQVRAELDVLLLDGILADVRQEQHQAGGDEAQGAGDVERVLAAVQGVLAPSIRLYDGEDVTADESRKGDVSDCCSRARVGVSSQIAEGETYPPILPVAAAMA